MPQRNFGSMPLSRRYREYWAPCVEAIIGATWQSSEQSILIDAPAEQALMQGRVPSTATNPGRLRIYFRDFAGAGVARTYNWLLSMGVSDCIYYVWGAIIPAQQVSSTVASPDMCWEQDLEPLLTTMGLVFDPGMIFFVRVEYAAAGGGGLASNLVVKGAVVLES